MARSVPDFHDERAHHAVGQSVRRDLGQRPNSLVLSRPLVAELNAVAIYGLKLTVVDIEEEAGHIRQCVGPASVAPRERAANDEEEARLTGRPDTNGKGDTITVSPCGSPRSRAVTPGRARFRRERPYPAANRARTRTIAPCGAAGVEAEAERSASACRPTDSIRPELRQALRGGCPRDLMCRAHASTA